MYLIDNTTPRTDITLSRFGLTIHIHPTIKQLAKHLTQEQIDKHIETLAQHWLTTHGYNPTHYPAARSAIRVKWGEWGIEHITIPGNACGLDISNNSFYCIFPTGRTLTPHNLDTWQQQNLLITIYTELTLLAAYNTPNLNELYTP